MTTLSDEEQLYYREVALERFHDAVVLYLAKRYSTSLYMSGYVIEIGIKHKFIELGNMPLSKATPQSILYLFMPTILPEMQKQPTKRFKDMVNLITQKEDKQKDKSTKNLSPVKTLMETRYTPGDKKIEGKKQSLHDIREFFEQLLEWYRVFNHDEVNLLEEFYTTSVFPELYPTDDNSVQIWSTNIRYEIPHKKHKEDALKHLNLCVTFLRDVLKYGRNEIGENFLAVLEDYL